MKRKSGWAKRAAWLVLITAALLLGLGVFCLSMPGRSFRGALPPLTSAQRELASELGRDVLTLSHDIGERRAGVGEGLHRAEDFLRAQLEPLTLRPGVKLSREALTDAPGTPANLVLDLAGETNKPLVLVGAHYDSAPGGTPGANDNGSGVASALALARRLSQTRHALPLRFVFFANEEMPYFQTAAMGALQHARGCAKRGEQLRAMFSLETMGHFSDEPGSQKYPPPLSSFYPDRGDFIGFVGNPASRALVRESIGTFRQNAQMPSEGAALPEGLPGVGWSDHWAFWQQGYPAVMVTDTALFRDPNYHRRTDIADEMDFERLARVVEGMQTVLTRLAEH